MQWRAFLPLWPAVAVWLVITLPGLAFSLGKTPELREVLPFPLSLFCLTRHVWPYTKVYRLGQGWAQWDEQAAVDGQEPTLDSLIQVALRKFPGEEAAWDRAEAAWWTPPAFATYEEADAWIDARQDARVRGYARAIKHTDDQLLMVSHLPGPRVGRY